MENSTNGLRAARSDKEFRRLARGILIEDQELVGVVFAVAQQIQRFATGNLIRQLDSVRKGIASLKHRNKDPETIAAYIERALDPDKPRPCHTEFLKELERQAQPSLA